MKISKITYKDKKGVTNSISLQRQDGIIYDIFFIYGGPGCGKTNLCKLISDAWQMNMFHGENPVGHGSRHPSIEIEASFNDMQPISFGIPSKLTSKNLIQSKTTMGEKIRNSILYYPWNRHNCIEEKYYQGEIITNACIPLMDLHDSSLQNCSMLIDNAARGMTENETKDYIQEINALSQKNNNQVIMFMDQINSKFLEGNSRSFCMGKEGSMIELCKDLANRIRKENHRP
jgi:hypothetical protein